MCVIAYKPSGKVLDETTIRKMFNHNPDGAGFMWAEHGKVHFEKGFFNVEELISRFYACVDVSMPAAIHCRIATHGGITRALCHPFPIARHSREFKAKGVTDLCMMHNGILPDYAYRQYADTRDSDTSAYAHKLYVNGLKGLPNVLESKRMEREINGSRLLFMDKNGAVVKVGNWKEVNGIFFSNLNHESYSMCWGYPSVPTISEVEKEADRACLIPANEAGYVVDLYGDYVDASDAYTDGASIFTYKGNHKWKLDKTRQLVNWY